MKTIALLAILSFTCLAAFADDPQVAYENAQNAYQARVVDENLNRALINAGVDPTAVLYKKTDTKATYVETAAQVCLAVVSTSPYTPIFCENITGFKASGDPIADYTLAASLSMKAAREAAINKAIKDAGADPAIMTNRKYGNGNSTYGATADLELYAESSDGSVVCQVDLSQYYFRASCLNTKTGQPLK